MIWGAMSSAGVGQLCFLKTNVTAPVYQDILEHFMVPSTDQLFKDADFIFKQDLAPAHTAKMRYMSDSLTPSLSACEEKSKAMASRVPHTRAYGNITSNTGAQQIHSDELNNSTDHLTEE